MTRAEIAEQIQQKKSVLCVGLDSDITKIPLHLHQENDPVFSFNKAIIDATKDFCVSYKINTAFYESNGLKGWESLQKTLDYIPKNCFTIADAKRGDIGNTADQYAKTFFETYPFDSVTVAPYMGEDSVAPFLQYKNKWAIVLGVTSNKGSQDFQFLPTNGAPLYQTVLKKVSTWGNTENLMFVVGATQTDQLITIRKIIPHHFLLIPGVGTQGGDLKSVCEHTLIADGGILINVSRSIIFASKEKDFAEKANIEAEKYQHEMKAFFK